MEAVGKIRRRKLVKEASIGAIARDLNLSRNTVRKYLEAETEPSYQRQTPPCPKLGRHQDKLTRWLEQDATRPKNQRRTAQRLFEDLQREGYAGAYDSVQRFIKRWKAERPSGSTDAFVPLAFPPGDAGQFDGSHEHVVLGGVSQTIELAHFRLSHSRQPFGVAYPRASQERVFDAPARAFAFYGGVPDRMIYDTPKTSVDAVCNGKARQFNRRFLALASHDLCEPVAWTPASGGSRDRGRTRSATSANGCSPPPRGSLTLPNSMPGWKSVAGRGQDGRTPHARHTPSLKSLPWSRNSYARSPRHWMAPLNRRSEFPPPAASAMTATATASPPEGPDTA